MIEAIYNLVNEAGQVLAQRIRNVQGEVGKLADRLDRRVEQAEELLFRARPVEVLPDEAPLGTFWVKDGDLNVYIGTGIGRPLRKWPTQVR